MIRKLSPVFLVVFLLACNITSVTTTPVQTDPVVPAVVETVPAPVEVVPVPSSSIEIGGLAYTAYQMEGDPFRMVCQEPCQLDLQYIYAEYAGFRAARVLLVQLTGIDTLPELQPVDMHLELTDSICQELPVGHAYVYADRHQAYTCTDGPGYYPTLEEKIARAALPDEQYFPLHEYMHTFFFGRLTSQAGDFADYRAAFFHDFVNPVPSFAIGILDPAQFCTYHEQGAPGDYNGWLIYNLCQQNGFRLETLSASLLALDALYQSGGGLVAEAGYLHPSPSVAQYRDILNDLLGSDTTPAFAEACWPPELFGSSYSVLPQCVVPVESGTATPVK